MNVRRHIAASVLAVALLGSLVACSGSDDSGGGASEKSGGTIAAVKKAGKLRACVAPEFKPEVYLDESNKPTGLDVELTEKMAENLEVKVEFIQTTFDGLIAGIQAGKCDISLSGVTPRGTRALAVSFAKPTVVAQEGLLVQAGDTRKSLADFNQASVNFCVQVGTGSETDTKAYFPKGKRTALSSAQDCILQVVSGKQDAFLTDTITGAGATEAQGGLKMILPAGVTLPAAPTAALVKLGDQEFVNYINTFFGEFINNGLYLPLCEKYMGDACDLPALLAQRGNF